MWNLLVHILTCTSRLEQQIYLYLAYMSTCNKVKVRNLEASDHSLRLFANCAHICCSHCTIISHRTCVLLFAVYLFAFLTFCVLSHHLTLLSFFPLVKDVCFLPFRWFSVISPPLVSLSVLSVSLCICLSLGMASHFHHTCLITSAPVPHLPINLCCIKNRFNLPDSTR